MSARSVSTTRIVIAVPGILLGLFGVFRLLTQIPADDLIMLAIWLAAAVVLHDGVLSPLLVGVGWTINHVVPPRARRALQAALIAGGVITVVALPLIYRQGSQPPSKAALRQDYGLNLAIALGIVAVVAVVGYLVSLRHAGRAQASTTNERPESDQDSTSA